MNVYGIDSSSSVSMLEAVARNRRRAEAEAGDSGDTVTLSREARRLADARSLEAPEPIHDAERAAELGGGAEFPVEAYSIPGWYVDMYGGYTTINAELGAGAEQARTGYEKLGTKDQQAFDEYSGILNTYFREELDRIGVSGDTGKYYNDFILNSANQSSVREAIVERLENNPRAMELMEYFGITI